MRAWIASRAGRLGMAAGLVAIAAAGLASLAMGQPAPSGDAGAAPAEAEQEQLRIASAVEFREAFGLASDGALVARLDEQRDRLSAQRSQLGFPLTAAEVDDLAERERELAEVEREVNSYVEVQAGDSFAGMLVDQQAGGILRVGFSDDAPQHLERLRARSDAPERITTFAADHSEAELDTFADRIGRDLDELGDLGVHQVAVDVEQGTVEVTASERTAALEEELAQRYPAAPIEVAVAEPMRLARANYGRLSAPPVVGAIHIYRFAKGGGTISCSAGYAARVKGRQARRLITAGHCGNRGDTWVHARRARPPYRIGRVKRDVYRNRTNADAMTIGLNRLAGSNEIFTPGTQRNGRFGLRSITRTEGRRGPRRGELVCRSGWGSNYYLGQGVFCGRILRTNVRARVFPGPRIVRRHVAAQVVTCEGDSGGPVYKKNTAKGIVSSLGSPFGSVPCGRQLLYSQIGYVQSRLNAQVLTR